MRYSMRDIVATTAIKIKKLLKMIFVHFSLGHVFKTFSQKSLK